jgi:hypothetical protein
MRRRSVPPSPSVSVSQSVNQRWRERPRCPALRVTRSGREGGRSRHRWSCRTSPFPRSECAGRTRRQCASLRVDIRRKSTARKPNEISSGASSVFPAEASRVQTQIQTSHHRVLDAGAVLGVVNALRSASTRPSAGPAGIDDASARHVFSNYAMVGNLSITERWLTRESRRRMLTSSRRCRMALPPFASTAYGARIRPAPTGHGIERNPKNRRVMHDDQEWFVGVD